MRVLLFSLLFIVSYSSWGFVPNSFTFDFEQETKLKLSKKAKKSQGSLVYQRPGKFRLKIHSPDQVELVSNGTLTWYYTAPFIPGEKGEVTILKNDKKNTALVQIFEFLKDDVKSSAHFKTVEKDNSYQIEFLPKTRNEIELSKIELFFANTKTKSFQELSKMVLYYPDGRVSDLAIKKIVTDSVSPQDTKTNFNFVIPENTTVVD